MLDKNNDDSSSSEDEIIKDALKEATDHQFLKNSYFCNQKSGNSDVSERTNKYNNLIEDRNANPVSLRKDLDPQEKFSNFGVSPSFQNYVAKKLDEIVEKSIRIKKKQLNNDINEKPEENDCGIKLLSSSTEFLTVEKESEDITKFPKKRKTGTIVDDKADLLKCKQVTVEPEQVLSKADTKAWTSKRKEPEFKYKRLKNGTLVEKT